MDIIFKCPKCQQELEVDAAGAGQEIPCPECGEKIMIPESAAPVAPATAGEATEGRWGGQAVNAIAASAAAKIEKHLKVPVRDKPSEKLIAKASVPLEVAAKESDRTMRVKTIRHGDCVEVGHDRFDEVVSGFLAKIGEQYLVSITAVTYSYLDIGSQKMLNDYGVMIVYKG